MNPPLSPFSPQTLALNAIVTGLESVERAIRELEADRVRLLAEAFELAAIEGEEVGGPERHTPSGPRGELALRAIRAELAMALQVGERTVDRHLAHAHVLTRQFPAVFSAFEAGEVSHRHASVICDAGGAIGDGDDVDAVLRRGAYAEEALRVSSGTTPAVLAARSRRIAERYAETSLEERHAAARKQRRVWVEDREDGMADLWAHLPATEAYAIKDRLTRIARSIDESERAQGGAGGSGDSLAGHRRRDEIRADVLADLLLKSPVGVPGAVDPSTAPADDSVRASVQVIVPVGLLAGSPARNSNAEDGVEDLGRPFRGDAPELEGYGPIDGSTARRLAGETSHWEMVRADEATGEVLAVDRYRPSEQMRRMLRARDRHCRFPGCRVPASRCDIDHTLDAQYGGATATDNLAHLCRGHHTLKHHTGWRVEQRTGGVLEWTSPTGRTRQTGPPGRVRFVPAEAPF